jgi:flavin reductase (DIM6/NTAB) family NADH-FMN oxidoreductase RutF
LGKLIWKPGTMIYPVPAVMVTCGEMGGKTNIITVSWAGTVCTDPAMTYVSIRPERHSYNLIKDSGEFVINLTTEDLARAADYCGVRSGRDVDKFKEAGLTQERASMVKCPIIKESPVNIECRVEQIVKLGSHDMFLAKVVSVDVDEDYIDDKGKFHLEDSKPICYSHGQYFGLKKPLGHFGFSVAKKKKKGR